MRLFVLFTSGIKSLAPTYVTVPAEKANAIPANCALTFSSKNTEHAPINVAIPIPITEYNTMVREKPAVIIIEPIVSPSGNLCNRIAKKIKASTGYTEAIGEELGIIGPDVAPSDYRTVQPKLKGDISGEVVHIYLDKFDLEGLKLFSQRGAETDYTFLANDTHSPYTDSRKKLDLSKPEERRYYAYYTMDEDEVGQKSDILTVVVP